MFWAAWHRRHFKDYLRIWTEFIPEMLFLASLFMYMCVLIIIKWLTFSVFEDPEPFGAEVGCYPGESNSL